MTTPLSPLNLPDAVMASSRRRPGGLTAICVIALVLGGLGLLSSFVGLAKLAMSSWTQKAFAPPRMAHVSGEMHAVQVEMQEKAEAAVHRYWGISVGLAVANIVIAGSLLTGGIMALRMNAKGRTLLLAAFVAAILYLIPQTLVAILVQTEMAKVMAKLMPRMMEAADPKGGSGPAQAAAIGATIAKAAIFLGIVMSMVLALAKVIFYAIGTYYLRRPRIRELFSTGC